MATFAGFGLDARLLQALTELNYIQPTRIQSEVIPVSLGGTDVLAKDSTGSGKTLAYVIPALNRVMSSLSVRATQALVLVPTRDLAPQVTEVFRKLTRFASAVRVLNLVDGSSDAVQRSELSAGAHIVVATPNAALAHLRSGALTLDHLTCLIIDEADILVAHDYADSLKLIAGACPPGVTVTMTSATLPHEVDSLASLVLSPERRLIDTSASTAAAASAPPTQYLISVPHNSATTSRYLLLYAFLRLRILDGKTIVFCNSTDEAYRARIFLEKFGVRAATLTQELPAMSRQHIVGQFNRGVVNVLVTCDADSDDLDTREIVGEDEAAAAAAAAADAAGDDFLAAPAPAKNEEFGVARGIDFKNIAFVVNFELPKSPAAYLHRVGRTARGVGADGTAITLYDPQDPTDAALVAAVHARLAAAPGTGSLEPFAFRHDQIEQFRYRVEDVIRGLTRPVVFAARVADLKSETKISDALRTHVRNTPEEMDAILTHTVRLTDTARHLTRIPDYLRPGATGAEMGLVTKTRVRGLATNKQRKHREQAKKRAAKNGNPLKALKKHK